MQAKVNRKLINLYFDYHKDGYLTWRIRPAYNVKVGDKAGSVNGDGYAEVMLFGKTYKTHRLIYLYHNDILPDELDHRDGDNSNNKIGNLRAATKSQNCGNRSVRKNSLTGFKGVSLRGKGGIYRARIMINGKSVSLGNYKTPEDAAAVYNIAALKYFGEFARLNTF